MIAAERVNRVEVACRWMDGVEQYVNELGERSMNEKRQGGMEEFCLWPSCKGIRHQAVGE